MVEVREKMSQGIFRIVVMVLEKWCERLVQVARGLQAVRVS